MPSFSRSGTSHPGSDRAWQPVNFARLYLLIGVISSVDEFPDGSPQLQLPMLRTVFSTT